MQPHLVPAGYKKVESGTSLVCVSDLVVHCTTVMYSLTACVKLPCHSTRGVGWSLSRTPPESGFWPRCGVLSQWLSGLDH